MALIPRAPLVTPPQTRAVQQPQGFANPLSLYTTGAPTVGTALMAQIPIALRPQPVQPFLNPGALYTPVPFGTMVLAQVPRPQGSGQTWTFPQFAPAAAAYAPPAAQIGAQVERARYSFEGFIQSARLSLYTTGYVWPAASVAAQINRTPAPHQATVAAAPLGLYAGVSYTWPAASVAAQINRPAPAHQAVVASAPLGLYSTGYIWPAATVTAQINRAPAPHQANVASAPVALYSATYIPRSALVFPTQVARPAVTQGFTQSAQLGLYQPQIYKPPPAPRFEDPQRLPYSFAYQGLVQSAQLSLYTTPPASAPDPTRLLRVSMNGRVLKVSELNMSLNAGQPGRELGVDEPADPTIVRSQSRTIH